MYINYFFFYEALDILLNFLSHDHKLHRDVTVEITDKILYINLK